MPDVAEIAKKLTEAHKREARYIALSAYQVALKRTAMLREAVRAYLENSLD